MSEILICKKEASFLDIEMKERESESVIDKL